MAARPCKFKFDGKVCRCTRCGFVRKTKVPCDRLHYACGNQEGHVPREPVKIPLEGPGTELKSIFSSAGIHGFAGCRCDALAGQMNLWGPDGCRLRMGYIVAQVQENGRAHDPPIEVPGEVLVPLVEEAIRLAEARTLSPKPLKRKGSPSPGRTAKRPKG